jgi:hypothetical protein
MRFAYPPYRTPPARQSIACVSREVIVAGIPPPAMIVYCEVIAEASAGPARDFTGEVHAPSRH